MSRKRMILGILMYVVLITVWVLIWRARQPVQPTRHGSPFPDYDNIPMTAEEQEFFSSSGRSRVTRLINDGSRE